MNLIESIDIAKSVTDNVIVVESLENIKKGVFSGETLTDLFRKEKIIGEIHFILSSLSFLGSLYIIKNQTMYLQNTIDLIYIIPGISISFGLDHLGLIFLIISNGLWFMTSLYSERYLNLNEYKNKSSFFIFFTFSMFATNAIIYSSNLVTTFIFCDS